MRRFIALPLSSEARRGAGRAVKVLQRGRWAMRWVAEVNRHLTLKFLGDQPLPRLDFSGIKPFELKFKGLGAFPDRLLPRSVWLGLKGDLKSFYRLAKLVNDEPVFPHITLGRTKPEMGRKQRLELGKIITKNRVLDIPQVWLVDRVAVYQSRLTPAGSVYTIKASYVFPGGGQSDPLSNLSHNR